MSNPVELQYSQPPARPLRRVLVWAGLGLIFGVLILLTGRWFVVPRWQAYQQLRAARAKVARQMVLQANCLNEIRAPNVVVLSSPAINQDSEFDGKYYSTVVVSGWGDDQKRTWASYFEDWEEEMMLRRGTTSFPLDWGTVLLHERHTLGGSSRLVSIEARTGGSGGQTIFYYSVITPGASQAKNTQHVRIPCLHDFVFDGEEYRVFAGQIDTNNAARFTIHVQTNYKEKGRGKVLEEDLVGTLNADDTVSIVPNRGYMPETAWEILKPDGQPLTPWNSPMRKIYGGGPQTSSTTRPQ